MNRFIFILVFFLYSFLISAQVPSNLIGSNRPGLQWSQINTPDFKIIFPSDIESTGQRSANIIQTLLNQDDRGLGSLNRKASILIHSEAAISNGFVTVGPFRSEFFPAQRAFGNSTDYFDLLTLHEFRHIQQFANATHGITKLVKNTLGSWAYGGLMATALPRWYFEGDAVFSETQYSSSGRGRLPSFNMQYRALLKEGIIHNYEKASAGSLIDYVPDWYPLGYNIIKYGRENYGEELWSEVVKDAVKYKGVFYPFSRSLKKRTGLSTSQMYNEVFEELMRDFQASIEKLELNKFQYVAQPKSKYLTNYLLPKVYLGDTIIVKSSLDQLPTLVRVKEGREEKLCEIGRQIDGPFLTISIGGSKITWAEFANDIRWRYRQYSDIYIYNIATKKKKRLTSKKRYYGPSLSNDGSHIAAISIYPDLTKSIEVLSSNDGSVIKSLGNKKFSQLAHPVWLDDNHVIVVATSDEQSRLVKVDIENDEWEEVTTPTTDQLSHPFVRDGSVFYSSSYSGINNIYRVHLGDGKLYKLTEVPVGAFHPFVSMDGSVLMYTEQERNGMKSKRTFLNETSFLDLKTAEESNAKNEPDKLILKSLISELKDTIFEVTKFNKLSGLLNPHSLLPQFTYPTASIALRSDNIFGTLSARAGASYNFNEDESTYSFGLSYAELFPVINLNYSHGYRSAQFYNLERLGDTSLVFTSYGQRWLEKRISGGIAIPLNLSSQNLNSRLRVFTNYQQAALKLEGNYEDGIGFRDTISFGSNDGNQYNFPIRNGKLSTVDIGLNYFAVKRQARLELNPKLGGAVSFRYRNQLGNELEGGDVFNFDATLYFPGFTTTHSLFFTAALQTENVFDNYRYSDIFKYSRGYDLSLRRDRFFKLGFNYSLPLWYPDESIGPLAFVKRIKANFFYDYSKLSLSSSPLFLEENMNSVGVEIGFDFRALRLVEVDLGFRYSYVFNPSLTSSGKSHQFDFLVISITQ